jgi:hypothetical protein
MQSATRLPTASIFNEELSQVLQNWEDRSSQSEAWTGKEDRSGHEKPHGLNMAPTPRQEAGYMRMGGGPKWETKAREDGGCTFLGNTEYHLPDYTVA